MVYRTKPLRKWILYRHDYKLQISRCPSGLYIESWYALLQHMQDSWRMSEFITTTDTLSAERIYGWLVGWSETRRCQMRNLEQRSHRIILQNSKCLKCELHLSIIENFLKKKGLFICFLWPVCSPFNNYFNC